ncbi:MAG: hypothetical protein IKM73_07900 [Acidaminococcaceae bacterium]|nr:hypothetical protein [Acidaminococcaceae bacterium]
MSELEKGFILGSLSHMDQASKNFVLGYMAGRCSDVVKSDKHSEHPEEHTESVKKEADLENKKAPKSH